MSLRLALTVVSALLSACATLPTPAPDTTACRNLFVYWDQQASEADAIDAGAHRIDGLPYLRSTRFLASFAPEAQSDAIAFAEWVELLRQTDMEKRSRELLRTGIVRAARSRHLAELDRCGRELVTRELSTDRWRNLLFRNVAVPDDYSVLARTFGFYPFAVPFLNLGISAFHNEVRTDYALPLEALDTPGPLTLWSHANDQPTPAWEKSSRWQRNHLGIPRIEPETLQFLAERHAPSFWVETASENDRIGAIRGGNPPTADVQDPVVYFLLSHTRFGSDVLPQLVYVAWFPSRPPESTFDSYAGALDGVVWRVTLDANGEPLIYDTIHPCGCYHYFFPVKEMKLQPAKSFWQEPVLVPQDQAPAENVAIRIQSGTHYVRRVIDRSMAASDEESSYQLRPYSDLEILPSPSGDPVSLFDSRTGIVRGTERGERFWLWPSGVPSPGAMRQWGRHATSFVGRGHFDESRLLDRLFLPSSHTSGSSAP